jgi:hypothetical protein
VRYSEQTASAARIFHSAEREEKHARKISVEQKGKNRAHLIGATMGPLINDVVHDVCAFLKEITRRAK